jgi:hypothetical protein
MPVRPLMWIFNYVHPHSDLIDGHTATTTAANQVVRSRWLKPSRGSTLVVAIVIGLLKVFSCLHPWFYMYVISAHETLEQVMTIFREEVKR